MSIKMTLLADHLGMPLEPPHHCLDMKQTFPFCPLGSPSFCPLLFALLLWLWLLLQRSAVAVIAVTMFFLGAFFIYPIKYVFNKTIISQWLVILHGHHLRNNQGKMLTTCLRCHYPTTIGVTSNSIDPKSDSAWDRAYRGLTSLPPLLLCVCVCLWKSVCT